MMQGQSEINPQCKPFFPQNKIAYINMAIKKNLFSKLLNKQNNTIYFFIW